MSAYPTTSNLGTWPLRSLPASACSRVFVRDHGHLVKAEYRIGPEVTCEAVAIKCPDGWVIDGIETLPTWRCHGHARAILERIVEISGMPVRAMEIDPGAEEFWAHMTELGINLANDATLAAARGGPNPT
jgi:hypothetical protein